ncbi:hypothetical protein F2P81_023814 [Scophthalmus maximus]|uniref:Uncharacterized protein n=1 Tax=Scophthalmus maximus TaxID=52904 RepID=A0A6A4RXJ5_SCOMX|nr:hypothetical protein F2P81_023814 [Scophthalmus maximus]
MICVQRGRKRGERGSDRETEKRDRAADEGKKQMSCCGLVDSPSNLRAVILLPDTSLRTDLLGSHLLEQVKINASGQSGIWPRINIKQADSHLFDAEGDITLIDSGPNATAETTCLKAGSRNRELNCSQNAISQKSTQAHTKEDDIEHRVHRFVYSKNPQWTLRYEVKAERIRVGAQPVYLTSPPETIRVRSLDAVLHHTSLTTKSGIGLFVWLHLCAQSGHTEAEQKPAHFAGPRQRRRRPSGSLRT